MAWPFDNEAQLDEWADQFIEEHSKPLPDYPAELEAYFKAKAESESESGNDDIEALLSNPDIFGIHRGHEEAVWRFILKVVERRPPEQVLGYLAAGLIEDLIALRGEAFIDRIETEARSSQLFRRTLHGVWQNSTAPDLWARVELARGPAPQPMS